MRRDPPILASENYSMGVKFSTPAGGAPVLQLGAGAPVVVLVLAYDLSSAGFHVDCENSHSACFPDCVDNSFSRHLPVCIGSWQHLDVAAGGMATTEAVPFTK